MAKSHDDIKQLQRLLNRVSQLDGAVVRVGNEVFVTAVERVIDPDALLAALASPSEPARSAIQAALDTRDLRRVDARWLATMARDVKVLETSPGIATLVEKAPRLFRKARVDRARVQHLRNQLEAIQSTLTEQLIDKPRDAEPIDEPVRIIRCLHGDPAARFVLTTWQRSLRVGTNARARARRRLVQLVRQVQATAGEDESLRQIAEGLRYAETMPGRARRRRVLKLVAQALSSFAPIPGHGSTDGTDVDVPDDVELIDEISAIGEVFIAQIPSTRGVHHRSKLASVLARYALMFPPRLQEPPISLGVDVLSRLDRAWPEVKQTLASARLSFGEVIAWVSLRPAVEHSRKLAAVWLQRGVPWDLVSDELGRGKNAALPPSSWPIDKATAYFRWKARLSPVLERAGIEADLGPDAFNNLKVAKNEDLAVLAVALTGQRDNTGSVSAQRIAEVFDATVGLFARVPASARRCLRDLEPAPPGVGRREDGELAAWLDDDALLDRYLQLRALLGEPAVLSTSLRRDADRYVRVRRQREYLEAKADRSPAMTERLRRMSERAETVSTEWTKRRMRERVEEMTARLYRILLDEALRDVIRGAFGITIPELTPAWWDVVRFYLRVDDNLAQLGTLLREATDHPGTFVPPRLRSNRAWLERASAHMDTEAWCRPHGRPLEVGGIRGVIALEQDPIEVLRMGVPFDTCLSIHGGCNAASAVINALDVNKRVIYFRNEQGKPVARKLIAISSEFRLLGYRLYSAIGCESALGEAFNGFCAELAARCGVALADSGVPEVINEGFWYDDGVQSFGVGGEEDVGAYLDFLGLPQPATISDQMRREAGLFRARTSGNVSLALSALRSWETGPAQTATEHWLIERIGSEELERLSERNEALIPVLARHRGRQGVESLLRAIQHIPCTNDHGTAFYLEVRALPAQPGVAGTLLAAARRFALRSARFDDHSIEHGTMYELPYFALGMSIEELLEACDDVMPVWDWVVEQNEGCADCRSSAVLQLMTSAARRYARVPDPVAVGQCLGNPRCSELAHRVALHIASIYPLGAGRGATSPRSALDSFEGRPQRATWVRKQLRQLARFRPNLAQSPTYLAAWLRQGHATPVADDDVPETDEAPFEALGDLVFHIPDLLDYLSRWGVPNCNPKDWTPGPWELYFHRRVRTPWRRMLVREVMRDGPGAQEAWKHLVLFGDISSLQSIIDRTPPRELRRLPGRPDKSYDPHLLCDDIQEQLAFDAEPLDTHIPRGLVLSGDRVDAGLLRRGLLTIRRYRHALSNGSEADLEQLCRALFVLHYPALSLRAWDDLLRELLTGMDGPLEPSVVESLEAALLALPIGAGLSPETITLLWQNEPLREATVAQLPAWADWAAFRRHTAACERASNQLGLSIDSLEDRWLSRLIQTRSTEEILANADEARIEKAVRLVFQLRLEATALEMLDTLPDAAAVAIWMRVFREQPEATRTAVVESAGEDDGGWEERRVRRDWLRKSAGLSRDHVDDARLPTGTIPDLLPDPSR